MRVRCEQYCTQFMIGRQDTFLKNSRKRIDYCQMSIIKQNPCFTLTFGKKIEKLILNCTFKGNEGKLIIFVIHTKSKCIFTNLMYSLNASDNNHK